MADLTQFTSSLPSFGNRHVVSQFVQESEYETISNVSDPNSANFNTSSPDYDPAFTSTLYYIRENDA